jgi:agmatinase
VVDRGDVFFDGGRPEQIPDILHAEFATVLGAGVTPLVLGGDHFVSFPALRAASARHGPLALIHFDAHSDTWRDDDGRIDHGTMFYHAALHGHVAPARSIQLGMRTHNAETHGFDVRDARWLHAHGVAAAIEAIRARVGANKCWVSFDVDFLDPSCAPGTGTPVVGGFNTHEALELLRGLAGLHIVGMDVVEVAPPFDHAGITALAAASIAHEMLCVLASRYPERTVR